MQTIAQAFLFNIYLTIFLAFFFTGHTYHSQQMVQQMIPNVDAAKRTRTTKLIFSLPMHVYEHD